MIQCNKLSQMGTHIPWWWRQNRTEIVWHHAWLWCGITDWFWVCHFQTFWQTVEKCLGLLKQRKASSAMEMCVESPAITPLERDRILHGGLIRGPQTK